MDLTKQNLETIHSIHLHNMTVNELVEADSQVESRIHFSKGIWWREVKPLFFQPAAFMTRITPHQAAPKPWHAIGGYYHMVPDDAQSNCVIVVNEVSDLASTKKFVVLQSWMIYSAMDIKSIFHGKIE